jgi:S1-C subfamily serine protease
MGRTVVTGFLSLIMIVPALFAAQSATTPSGIPAIAKAAKGCVVSIVMSDKEGKPISQGSGFFVTKDGLILTNYHVIDEGSSAVAKLPDGTSYAVDGVVTFDKARDLAVIKAHGQNFPTLQLGDSDQVQVGEEVVAIGNPLSLDATVSNGIVSGIRAAKEEGGKLLQITAPISIGSSGGPLFNMSGTVIGITTMYLKGGENLNFAIPINAAKPLLAVGSSRLEAFPDEIESGTRDVDAFPSASSATNSPNLKATIAFMGRMVEPERRDVLQGPLQGAERHSTDGPSISIISHRLMLMAFTSGVTYSRGYPELTYSVVFDSDNEHEQKDYPRYISFALGDIDPTSIVSKQGGFDPYALSGFWDKHPKCERNPECAHDYLNFLDSAPKMTEVQFHTTDHKPLIERGGCSKIAVCRPTEKTGNVLILFKNKDRADRFVTALAYAVKLAGGQPDLFSLYDKPTSH